MDTIQVFVTITSKTITDLIYDLYPKKFCRRFSTTRLATEVPCPPILYPQVIMYPSLLKLLKNSLIHLSHPEVYQIQEEMKELVENVENVLPDHFQQIN
jgi:hypothetical protein